MEQFLIQIFVLLKFTEIHGPSPPPPLSNLSIKNFVQSAFPLP